MKDDHPEENQGFFKKLGIRLFKKDKAKEYDTETEIKNMISEGHEKGEIEKTEAEMINNIFEFAEKEANDVMVHRTGISAIEASSTIGEAFARTMEDGFSRYPVYIDDLDQIIGIFHIRDLVKVYAIEENRSRTLLEMRNEVLFDAYIIPETRNISQLLKEMQHKKSHMAIVVDEYGQTAGLVTMEDILEEIFGNIWDEHDKPEIGIVRNADGTYVISGQADLEEVADSLGIDFELDEISTLNGFMTYKLGHIPNEGEEFETVFKGYSFEIIEVKDKVVTKVKISRKTGVN